jgi:hypothetical protein
MAINTPENIEELSDLVSDALLDMPVGKDEDDNVVSMRQLLVSLSTSEDNKLEKAKEMMMDSWTRIGGAIMDYIANKAVVRVVMQNHRHQIGASMTDPPDGETEVGIVE